jgi:hypothetical protein
MLASRLKAEFRFDWHVCLSGSASLMHCAGLQALLQHVSQVLVAIVGASTNPAGGVSSATFAVLGKLVSHVLSPLPLPTNRACLALSPIPASTRPVFDLYICTTVQGAIGVCRLSCTLKPCKFLYSDFCSRISIQLKKIMMLITFPAIDRALSIRYCI